MSNFGKMAEAIRSSTKHILDEYLKLRNPTWGKVIYVYTFEVSDKDGLVEYDILTSEDDLDAAWENVICGEDDDHVEVKVIKWKGKWIDGSTGLSPTQVPHWVKVRRNI